MNYDTLASKEQLSATIMALNASNIQTSVVATKEEALEKIKTLIPKGSAINNGTSQTLKEIGFVDYLKANEHGWDNLHANALAETDPTKQGVLRNMALFADYYLGSVHAVAETGELVIASASGSQLPPIAFTSQNLILVVSTQKIVPTLPDAFSRVRDHVFALEDARMKATGAPGSVLSKILIIASEPAFMGRTVHVLFVEEKLGF